MRLILLLIGSGLMIFSARWLRKIIAEHGSGWNTAIRVPVLRDFANVAFAVTHLDVAWKPFLMQLLGLPVLITALALGHKERQEEERAAEAEFNQFMSNITVAVEAAERGEPVPAAAPALAAQAAPPTPAPAKKTAPRPAPRPVEPRAQAVAAKPPPDNRPPVSVEFVSLAPADTGTLGTLRFRAQNRASRPVREVKLALSYLDETGRPLKQYETIHSGDPVVVGPEATVEFEMPAFEMPRFTSKVRPAVKAVEFQDGTRWPAEP